MAPNPIKQLITGCWLALILSSGTSFAQDSDAAGSEAGAEDPSRETDISEDNYRRFMELDDRRLERPAFPVSAIQPTTGLQKMGQLPESSQKHLRNQLRGIILRRGAWTPTERDETYPFVPSTEAQGDAQLLRQEAEAWDELVNEYHDREAAILAGAAGQSPGENGAAQPDQGETGQAATGAPPGSQPARQANAETGASGNPSNAGQPGQAGTNGQEGRDGAQGGTGSEGGPDSKSGVDSNASASPAERPEIPDWASEDDAASPIVSPANEGVEQNASAYLQARGLVNEETVEFQGSQGRETPASVERASRWGEDAQTLLDDLETEGNRSHQRAALPPSNDRTRNEAPTNSLTREELRGVRGITGDEVLPEGAFDEFNPGSSGSPSRRDFDEATPEAADGGEETPVPDDGDRSRTRP